VVHRRNLDSSRAGDRLEVLEVAVVEVVAVEVPVAVLHMGLAEGDDHAGETALDELVRHSEKALGMVSSAALVLGLAAVGEEEAVVLAEHHDARMDLAVVVED
jgi:hypothetical protein